MRSFSAPTVWSWWTHDACLAQHLVFATAVPRDGQFEAILRRLGLPDPAIASRLLPYERGYAEAVRAPGHLLWMPLDEFGTSTCAWRSEEQLRAARSVTG
jgi:hypothetical protein